MICMKNQKSSMCIKKGPTISNLCQGEFYWVNSRNIPEYVSHALYYQLQFLPLLCPTDRQANRMWWGLRTDAENLTEDQKMSHPGRSLLAEIYVRESSASELSHQMEEASGNSQCPAAEPSSQQVSWLRTDVCYKTTEDALYCDQTADARKFQQHLLS